MSERPTGVSTIVELFGVVRRRKLIVIVAAIVVPVAAAAYAQHKPKIYASGAQVLLSRENIAATYAGIQSPTGTEDPVRYDQTQAFLARSPKLAATVAADSKLGIDGDRVLANSSVTAAQNADLLTFLVERPDPHSARLLADLYARDFTIFRRNLDTQALRSALSQVQRQIALLTPKELGAASGQTLLDRQQQLQTLAALEQQNASVARPASVSVQVAPKPARSAEIGLIVGLVLGIGFAYLRELFDQRIRSAEEVASRFGLPILARIPAPPREFRDRQGLVMLEQPYSSQGETFRMLKTSLDLALLGTEGRTLMVTSGLESEGKTTTAANLAVAMAMGGRDVCLVDLDLRRPSAAQSFGLPQSPGFTNVALGAVALEDALHHVDMSDVGNRGTLAILAAGPTPPFPAEVLSLPATEKILQEIAGRYEIVIVDAPPALHASEAITLATRVDSVLVVVRLEVATRGSLTELQHLLDRTPVKKVGIVVAGAGGRTAYGYGYGRDGDGYGPRVYDYPDQDLVL
jgi:capsular exopolysaccharide synthesis family protein